jgi:hypothetical protein
MHNVDPAFVQQVFNVPQRERIPDIHHNRQADDLGARLEVAEKARVADAPKAIVIRSDNKPIFP